MTDPSPSAHVENRGGGYSYVAHGIDLVLLAFSPDVDWWRNSVSFTPDAARQLAAVLIEQADRSDEVHRGAEDD